MTSSYLKAFDFIQTHTKEKSAFQKSSLWRECLKIYVFGDHLYRRKKIAFFKTNTDTCGRGLSVSFSVYKHNENAKKNK